MARGLFVFGSAIFVLVQLAMFVYITNYFPKVTFETLKGCTSSRAIHTDYVPPCIDVLDEFDCKAREECYAIMALPCHGSKHQELFVTCINREHAVPILKEEDPDPGKRITDWMVGHPDHGATEDDLEILKVKVQERDRTNRQGSMICAIPPEGLGEQPLLRFPERILPDRWRQRKCGVDCCPPIDLPLPSPHTKLPISIVALVYREYDSFKNALDSWIDRGLLDLAQEFIVFLNAKRPTTEDPIESLLLDYQSQGRLGQSPQVRILSSPTNLGIGKALAHLVLTSRQPYVLFLEKDWEVVEEKNFVERQLQGGLALIQSEVGGARADAVKFRSRWKAGDPNIDPALCKPPPWDTNQEGGEGVSPWAQYHLKPGRVKKPEHVDEDYQWWLPHLFCNLYHFQKDQEFLGQYHERAWRCGCQGNFLCFDSGQCGWTNNPMLFPKHWWVDTFYDLSQRDDNKHFEGGTYYSNDWILPHWVVAEGDGFFSHHEINEH